MDNLDILVWLGETRPDRLDTLWQEADRCRRENVGPAVHLRGLVEFSNRCVRNCTYCGLRAQRRSLRRYRMDAADILDAVRYLARAGVGTVVLQSGEDPSNTRSWVAGLVRAIRDETPLAVTLSLGERSEEDLAAWREAGADRYLLRFETSRPGLYRRLRPGRALEDRLAVLAVLRDLGYEVGTGFLVGLPGQSRRDVARDLRTLRDLDPDMIGLGPYLPHPRTPLGRVFSAGGPRVDDPFPHTEAAALKVLALARLLCPETNIPATSALATLAPATGRRHGLDRGANVIMPNLTPAPYRRLYEIYPRKTGSDRSPDETLAEIQALLDRMERPAGVGRGDAPRYYRRVEVQA